MPMYASRKILIVDDDRLILSTLGRALRAQSYEVLEASTGGEAMKIATEHAPDLAILDVRLDGESGIELGHRLAESTQTPFLFLSAYAEQDVVKEASCGCALGYLVKPVSPTNLIPTIETALTRAAEIRKLKCDKINLTAAMCSDRRISMAIGILMERHRKPEDDAFELLRMRARSQRRKIIDVAAEIVQAVMTLDEPGEKRPGRPEKSGR